MLFFGWLILLSPTSLCGNPQETNGINHSDSVLQLPLVLAENHTNLINSRLRFEAATLSALQKLPGSKKDWLHYRTELKKEIIKRTGIVFDPNLPLDLKETGSVQMQGYTIRNIYFQTHLGIYATANLYVPDGEGKFPGVIVMMGHSQTGRLDDRYQSLGHTLALNGYVALCIDPWGSGERTTTHGVFEDHGDENNLGSSVLNIGETLMGIEISDNIRGVDLLFSLSFVDAQKIGATGSSGGGNQTMWLAAMDERVKAAVPVVSAGTFESYIMGSPCICEVLSGGLTFTEESGILALIAPRALKMINHNKDSNQAFYPAEMIRSYNNAKPIFGLYGSVNNIGYQLFDLTHGYMVEDRETMLGWFDLHLKSKGDGSPKKEIPFELLTREKLMVFSKAERDPKVLTTVEYCKFKGNELKINLLNSKSINIESKKQELKAILGIRTKPQIRAIHEYNNQNGWKMIALESSDNKLIPILLRLPANNMKDFVVFCDPRGKSGVNPVLIDQIIKSGKGIVLVDLSGIGETAPTTSKADKNGNLRTISRSLFWFGKTLIGEWTSELGLVCGFLSSNFQADRISIDGNKEAGLAALFLGIYEKQVDQVVLRNAPVSYLFDTLESIDFYSMGIHIPGILKWGDISLASAISGKTIIFIGSMTMSGHRLNEIRVADYRKEFEMLRSIGNKSGKTIFLSNDEDYKY